jgi:hypothetical protein
VLTQGPAGRDEETTMKRMITYMAVAGALTLGSASAAGAADGKAVFTQLKCNSCHAIASQGIKVVEEEAEAEPEEEGEDVQKPSDLSDVGSKRTAAWIKDWLTKKVDLEGKKHRKKFDGKPAELEALATWLASLKEATK